MNYVCSIIILLMLFFNCIPTAGGGREGEGVLTAFLVCSYCLHIVFRLEGGEEEEEGIRQGMIIVVVSY